MRNGGSETDADGGTPGVKGDVAEDGNRAHAFLVRLLSHCLPLAARLLVFSSGDGLLRSEDCSSSMALVPSALAFRAAASSSRDPLKTLAPPLP